MENNKDVSVKIYCPYITGIDSVALGSSSLRYNINKTSNIGIGYSPLNTNCNCGADICISHYNKKTK